VSSHKGKGRDNPKGAGKKKNLSMEQLMQHVTVVSDDEAEKADMVVCLPDTGPRYFTDDVTAQCAMCGITIRHRPHVPKAPPKVCINCALFMSEANKPSA
jgi:hypothetical protein